MNCHVTIEHLRELYNCWSRACDEMLRCGPEWVGPTPGPEWFTSYDTGLVWGRHPNGHVQIDREDSCPQFAKGQDSVLL